jgi:hypothetical protein
LAERYPYQYRFTVNNLTGSIIDKVVVKHHDQQESVDNFQAGTKAKFKMNYWEADTFYLVATRAGNVDTIFLPIGGTNSIGYIYSVDIKIKNNKITAYINNEENSSH